MQGNILLIIYTSAASFLFLLLLITGKKNKKYYDSLDKKEHPLRFFYPAAAAVYSTIDKLFKIKPHPSLVVGIRRLYVKENVTEEVFLHTIKKIALVLTVLFVSSLLGSMLCLAHRQIEYVDSLERNQYGQGTAVYDLEISYEGEEETFQIAVDEQRLTKDEILKKFEESAPFVRKQMLGENNSAEHVTKPLELISSYEGIAVSWEIEDTSVLDYNGNISSEIGKEDHILLNLYATFQMDEVTETFTMPVVISADTSDKRAVLIRNIMERIEADNSAFDPEVRLPAEVDGKKIAFSKAVAHNEYVFLLLALAAVFLILFGYDRNLDKRIRKRNEQMMLDFSEIVSKLSLLYEAGLSIFKAWERIVEDHEKKEHKEEHFAYQEMRMTLEKIKSGVSEKEAYAQFGKRCGLHPYIKLGNILEQNLSKGTKGMKNLLKQEVADSFEERKRIARKRGEEASTKLLVPMVIMLVIVIVIIAVPALMTMRLG